MSRVIKIFLALGLVALVGLQIIDQGADANTTLPAKEPLVAPARLPVPPAEKKAVAPQTLEAVAAGAGSPRRINAEVQSDLFATHSFAPPPPPPPPPPKPVAPAFPYVYGGAQREGDNITLFLKMGARNIVARPGDTLDGTYRLDGVVNGVAAFTYLPLNEQQRLPIGNLN